MENGKSGSGKDRTVQRPIREKAPRKAEKTNDEILKAPAKSRGCFFGGKKKRNYKLPALNSFSIFLRYII